MSEPKNKFQTRMQKIGLSENEISLFEAKFSEGASVGTLYATKNHLCFYSVGRKQAISWEDVSQMEKKKVNLIINGIEITLKNSSKIAIVLPSGRDDAYQALTGIWNIYHKAKQIVQSEKAKTETPVPSSQPHEEPETNIVDKTDKKSKRSSVIVESSTSKSELKPEIKTKVSKDAVSGEIHLKIWYHPESEDPKILGTLVVQVLAGRNLIAKDKNGLSDPFCEIASYKRTRKTKVIKETLNPEWNEQLEYNVRSFSKQQILQVTVWDEDTITNDFMGVFRVDLSPAFQKPHTLQDPGHVIDNWFTLLTKKEFEETKTKGLDGITLGEDKEAVSRRSSVSSATSVPYLGLVSPLSDSAITTEDDTSTSEKETGKKEKKSRRRTLTKAETEQVQQTLFAEANKTKGLEVLLDAQPLLEHKQEMPVVNDDKHEKTQVRIEPPTAEAPKPEVKQPEIVPQITTVKTELEKVTDIKAPEPLQPVVVDAKKPEPEKVTEISQTQEKIDVTKKPEKVVEISKVPEPLKVEVPKKQPENIVEISKKFESVAEKIAETVKNPEPIIEKPVQKPTELSEPTKTPLVHSNELKDSKSELEKSKEISSVSSSQELKLPEQKPELKYVEKEGELETLEQISFDEIFRTNLISATEKHPELFNFLYLVVTLQRTKESAIFGLIFFVILTLMAWSNFTLVSCVILIFNAALWTWFFSDYVELRVPWTQILTDPKDRIPSQQIVDFVFLLRRLTIVGVLSAWNRFFSATSSLKAAGVCLLVMVLGFYVNGYLLTYALGGGMLVLLHHIGTHQKKWQELCETFEKKIA